MTGFCSRLRQAPLLRKRDLWITILLALLWYGAIQLRPVVIDTRCMSAPDRCTAAHVPAMDQPGIGIENGDADYFSLVTQNGSGVLAVGIPALWNAGLAIAGRLSPMAALVATGVDSVIFCQAWFGNGFLTESARLVVQRPRPFVYADPARANDPHNYTSFYSGHTSFAAAACMTLLLTLLGRGAGAGTLLAAGLMGQALVFSTGIYRVLSGRHFVSDVLVGAAMGTLVALFVAWTHRRKGSHIAS